MLTVPTNTMMGDSFEKFISLQSLSSENMSKSSWLTHPNTPNACTIIHLFHYCSTGLSVRTIVCWFVCAFIFLRLHRHHHHHRNCCWIFILVWWNLPGVQACQPVKRMANVFFHTHICLILWIICIVRRSAVLLLAHLLKVHSTFHTFQAYITLWMPKFAE